MNIIKDISYKRKLLKLELGSLWTGLSDNGRQGGNKWD